jgi:hypothetical protein
MPVPGAALPAWPEDLLPPPFVVDPGTDAPQTPGLLGLIAALVREPQPGRDLVVVLDGVGADLLAEHRGLTPVLRRLAGSTSRIRTVAPTTTATAMVSLLTGAPPLAHGVLGYTTRDPDRDEPLNQIQGGPAVVPEEWMPVPTLLEAHPRRAIQVGPAKHAGSHLSRVAFRGWEFRGHGRHDAVETTLAALRAVGPEGLVHLHVDQVDHTGHQHGVDSEAWRTALADADSLLGTLLRRAPAGTRVHVTADHGMVDTSPQHLVDLADHPRLQSLAAVVAGEARALALTAVDAPAAVARLSSGLQELLGERALVLTRDQVLRIGMLGPIGAAVPERVSGRIPDVLVLARGRWSVDDYSRRPARTRAMIGVHGSLTSAEAWVPLVRVDA